MKQKFRIIRISHCNDPDIFLPDKAEVLFDPVRESVGSYPLDQSATHPFGGRQFTVWSLQDLFRGSETIDETLK